MIIGQVGVTSLLVLYLYDERGWSAAAAAVALGTTQLGAALARVAAGRWSDLRGERIEPFRRLATAAGLLLLAATALSPAPAAIAVPVLMAGGIAAMSWNGLSFTAAAEISGRRQAGKAMGIQNTAMRIVAAGVPVALGALASGVSWAMAFAVMGGDAARLRARCSSRSSRTSAAAAASGRRACSRLPSGPRVTRRCVREICSGSRAARRSSSDYIEERGFSDYHELWRWSVEDLEGFWGSIWERYEVGPPPERVLGRRRDAGRRVVPGHAAELRRAAVPAGAPGRDGDRCTRRESSPLAELSWDELREQTARCAAGLRRLGVGRGDRVAAYMPNVPETVVAFLACASIGAVWSSCAPEFGVPTVVDRFEQIEPRVLLATEGYRYGGKDFDRRERVREIEAAIPSLEHTVLVPSRLGRAALRAGRARVRAACPSTTRSGCSTRRAPPACPRRSCRARAASCSST